MRWIGVEDHEVCFPRENVPSNFKDKNIRGSTSNSEDKICEDARSNNEDKTLRCISPQDVGSDDISRHPVRKDESRLSSEGQLDNILRKEGVFKNVVAFKPEMNCEVINNNNYWNDRIGVIKTNFIMRPKNRDMKMILGLKGIPMERM